MLALALLLATAGADTPVLTRNMTPDETNAVVAACNERWSCEAGARVNAALADAVSLGISCDLDDTTCWQRFVAAEGFTRVVVAGKKGAEVRVFVVDGAGASWQGAGPDGASALRSALAPPPTTTATTTPPPPPAHAPDAPPSTPSSPIDDAPPAPGDHAVALVTAGVSAGVALLAGAGAGLVSADLSRSLDAAAAREAPLEGYDERNALFFSLAAASGVAAIAAGTAAAVALWGGP
jgi:hypothetical protein